MVSPDNTKVNYIPDDGDSSLEESSTISPVQSVNQPTKDFKKILGKDGKKSKESEELSRRKSPVKLFTEGEDKVDVMEMTAVSKDDEENASQMAAISLFDLSKKEHSKIKEGSSLEKDVAHVESPSDLFKRISSKKTKDPSDKKPISNETLPQENFTSRYLQEQPDLAYVNPLAYQAPLAAVSSTQSTKTEAPKEIDPSLPILIEQLVKHMYTVQQAGKTETVMTLQYPPLFKDAQIIVTAYDTAKGQFNITIENLTQAAQKILDREENRKSLLLALEQKGYNVQVVTTTTAQTQNLTVTEANPRESREQREESRQQQKRQFF